MKNICQLGFMNNISLLLLPSTLNICYNKPNSNSNFMVIYICIYISQKNTQVLNYQPYHLIFSNKYHDVIE